MVFGRLSVLARRAGNLVAVLFFEERIMKANRSIMSVLLLCCALMLHAGCQEETATQQQTPPQLSPNWFSQFEPPAEQQPAQPAPPVQPTVARQVSQPRPQITFDAVVYDFGNVGLQTQSLCEFRFTNTGEAVLTIDQIVKTCGACTAFQLDKTQYEPGESGTLKVKFYSDTQTGRMTKNLIIHTNDPANPEVTLAVAANVISKVEFEPKSLNLLLSQENAACPKITLTSTDGRPFSISHFRATSDCISVEFDPSVKAVEFVLEPKIDMARLADNLNGRIEIGLTHPECRTVSLPIKTVPKYKFSPMLVRGARPKVEQVKKVRILSNYGENFSIASVESENGTARLVSTNAIGNGYELEIEIRPPDNDRMHIFTEKIIVTTGSGDKIEIPCTLFYSQDSEIQAAEQKEEKCTICGPRVITSEGVKARDF